MSTAIGREPTRARAAPSVPEPRVLAIVVTHRGRPWLRACLTALNTQSYSRLDVLVVDDASPEWRRPPHLKRVVKRHLGRRRWGFLRTRRSMGFGGAINWAMSRVRTDAELLLFVHDDVVLERRSVEHMVARALLDDAIAIVGPKIVAWDDPTQLEEVGMAIDRFGYPYKGLEKGEIDLGQHDHPSEVFYVTSTCMLVRHGVFRDLRGWDERMRAFSEDLDLCWRARVAGHAVYVEPGAAARHAIALATGQRESRWRPTRYFSRRNRLRTVAKNASMLRLLALVPQFVLLSFAEMIGFIVLRQPGEIVNLLRALLWNLVASPGTLAERLRVQRSRAVTDRRLRRLTVRETTRLRAYLSYQADRVEEAWGRRTELVARHARVWSRSLRGVALAAAVVAVAGLALGFRHFLLSGPATFGELLPFPERAGGLWRAFLSPWRPVGLGQPGPAPPALALLGLFPWLAFGAAGAAQKALVAALGATAFAGAYRFLSEVADRPSRLVAGLVYALGPVGYAGIRAGALGALVFGAVAPFVVHSLLRTIGWARPPGWGGGRALARIALGSALCAAFVPGSLLLLGASAVVLGTLRLLLGPRLVALRGLVVALPGLAGGWALLLPWSAGWLEGGGALESLIGDDWRVHAAGFSGHGMATVLLGQTPEAPPLVGLGAVVLGVLGLLLAEGQRRRVALALAGVVVLSGWVVSAIATGLLRPVVASPVEAGVVAWVGLAGLAGLGVASFRLDLPRRRLGIAQALALTGLGAGALLLAAGIGPALLRGEWAPGRGAVAQDIEQIRSLLAADEGTFRALWVGTRWASAHSGSARPAYGRYLLTGPQGQSLTDLFERRPGPGTGRLEAVIGSVEGGDTDVGGHLLGPFNLRYVVVARAAGAHRWLGQRDLAVIREEPGYLLFENAAVLPRAAAYDRIPPYAGAGAPPTKEATESLRASARRLSASSFAAPSVAGPGAVWLAEARSARWHARVGGADAPRLEGGWANAYSLPSDARGKLTLAYVRPGGELVALAAVAVAWVTVAGAAFSAAPPPGRHGIRR
jgi:GT2 family glycosyltransferase